MTQQKDIDFEDDLHLDKYKLDDAVETQASTYARWAKEYMDSMYDRDKAKDKLELVKAQLSAACRQEWKSLQLGPRISNEAVENWVIDQDDYKDALKDFREKDRIMNILKVAEQSFSQRKYMIQAAVQLYASQYFAEPNTKTQDAGKEIKRERRNQEVSEKISERMRRRKESE